jgi:hypothetical protein
MANDSLIIAIGLLAFHYPPQSLKVFRGIYTRWRSLDGIGYMNRYAIE